MGALVTSIRQVSAAPALSVDLAAVAANTRRFVSLDMLNLHCSSSFWISQMK